MGHSACSFVLGGWERAGRMAQRPHPRGPCLLSLRLALPPLAKGAGVAAAAAQDGTDPRWWHQFLHGAELTVAAAGGGGGGQAGTPGRVAALALAASKLSAWTAGQRAGALEAGGGGGDPVCNLCVHSSRAVVLVSRPRPAMCRSLRRPSATRPRRPRGDRALVLFKTVSAC